MLSLYFSNKFAETDINYEIYIRVYISILWQLKNSFILSY